MVDNNSAIFTALNPVTHKKSKDIRIKYHRIIKECFQKENPEEIEIELKKIDSNQNISDIMTKQEPLPAYRQFRDNLIVDIPK